MAITDKTRKILWGRSGNRCAMCRHELVVDATPADDESVVGDECHIISAKGQGPRYDPKFAPEELDAPENLILLCRTHHKMVDDQFETYTAEVLRALKANHEKWVSSALTEADPVPPIRVKRIKENIPTHLGRLSSGREVLSVVDRAAAFDFDHDELGSPDEVEIVATFLQEAQEYGDLSGDLEAGKRVRVSFEINERIEELHRAGLWVFGGREVRVMEGGIGSPSPFPVAILRIRRSDSPGIIGGRNTKRPPSGPGPRESSES